MTAKQAKRQRQREARETRHRVFMREPVLLDELPAVDDPEPVIRAFLDKCDRERARKIHPVVRLDEEGIDWGVEPRDGDLIGFGMHPYRFVPIGSQDDEETEKTPRVPVKRPNREKGSE
jgi:hypothetical protein